MSDHHFQVGDWVTVTARVAELHPNGVDLSVELFSKTDQFYAFVRHDLCAPTAKPLPKEPGDRSVVLLNGAAYQRLAGALWFVAGASGGLGWAELNELGDVEVIHHA